MRALVFANGTLNEPGGIRDLLRTDDQIIAADGGARHCQRAGLLPQVVIGDFDSLSAAELMALESAGAQILRYPERKDFTDLELALQYAVSVGVSEALLFGALGDRWDQTLANLLLPAAPGLQSLQIRLVDGRQEISLLRPGAPLAIQGKVGETVSLIPLGGDVQGITTSGLEYALHGETLYFGATRGISNLLVQEQATVQVEEGLLLCIIIHTRNL